MSAALACDLVVATETAALTLAFTKVGLMPDGGATATVAASVGRARAMRLALLSDLISAREAFDAGLVSHVFADDDYAGGLNKIVGASPAVPHSRLRPPRRPSTQPPSAASTMPSRESEPASPSSSAPRTWPKA